MTAKHCPQELGPEIVVKLNDVSLLLPPEVARVYIREHMTEATILDEINSICMLAAKRSDYGIYGMLGLKHLEQAYSCVDSGESLLTWMHYHEIKRLHLLKLALPSAGELAEAARKRIRARIEARKEAHQRTQSCELQTQSDSL